jgi:isoleucyl-tRNA synthetase
MGERIFCKYMNKIKFKTVTPNINFPQLEEEILKYWRKNNIFEKSIQTRPADKTWNFVDGPPFITGLPHYGTLLSSIPKDLFPRYWTMKGYRVRRVWGWDCHGLPAENKVEKDLGIKRKKDIEEKVGVKKFIEECKSYVNHVSGEWEWYVDHIGRWVDFTNSYKTMDLSYMESVMWVFKNMYEKGYIYKGLRVSLYCPHCVTPISNFEVAMDPDNYQEVSEASTTYKYQMADEKDTYILAWSTTPWNKIATPALAINPKLTYVKVKQRKEYYILAESTLGRLNEEPYSILEKFSGEKLLNRKFIPHYDFYKIEAGKRAFVIIGGDFVTAEEGTGVVTIAAYGEDDLNVMIKENIQIVQHINEEGILNADVPNWAGQFYLKVNPLVNEDLAKRGLVYRDDKISHKIPTCWRCHTRLIYAPQNAWYVNIQNLKTKLHETNEAVNWFPSHFKYGRYIKSLEGAPDWCISRNRYWGSPVPVWECECGERFVPGSIAELEKKAGVSVTDLHKPGIDEITIKCDKCDQITKRTSEVLDSWIEAGSAPYAERHYPFDQSLKLEKFFPPDFIVEYTGQIRAWFYVLHVIATALFDSNAFKNVVVTGVILGSDGRKMSKNFGNYPDPKEMLSKYGGDALRLYLLGSPVMHGEDILISEEQYRNQIRGFLLTLWNIYNFFLTYADIDKWSPKTEEFKPKHILDKWITSRLHSTINSVTNSLENYDSVSGVKTLKNFIDDFSGWYVRRIRDRVGPSVSDSDDKNECFRTLYENLINLTKILAPFTPFIAESMFTNLTGKESVHLEFWPVSIKEYINESLESDMIKARQIVELGHSERKLKGIKLRQPLRQISYKTENQMSAELEDVIKDELNVKNISYQGKVKTNGNDFEIELDMVIDDELKNEGLVRELVRQVQIIRKEKGCKINELIKLTLPNQYRKFDTKLISFIQKETLAESLLWGEVLQVLTG